MRGPTSTDDEDEVIPCLGVGFASGVQNPKGLEHEHSFGQVQPHRMFSKEAMHGVRFSTLYCECGVTAEIIAEDTRPLSDDERKQLGIK